MRRILADGGSENAIGTAHVVSGALLTGRGQPTRMLRVIDESGEDYLYPAGWFVPITLPIGLRSALKAVPASTRVRA